MGYKGDEMMKHLLKNLFISEKVFCKWFISSLVIIFIFIISGIFLYLGALTVTKQTLLIAQEQSAEQVKNLIDVKLLNIKKDISALALNGKIISTSYIEPPFTADDYYYYHQAGKELTGIYLYKNISDIYLYYVEGGCFVGCNNLIYDKIELFVQEQFGMNLNKWKSMAKSR